MQGSLIRFGAFAFDRERLTLSRDGHPVGLNSRGAALLAALLDANGAIVRKEALMDAAWPGTLVEEGNLSVQIAALRRALGERQDGEEWIATVPRVGYRLVESRDEFEGNPLTRRPSIAVLPFLNLNSDREQDYFADGVVEEIITALSRFHTFAVVSRTSSFVYKDRAIDARAAARELGVRYLLEGSVRRSGDKVRVTAQLIDGESGAHLWAEKFDVALADIFDVQDAITGAVIGFIEPRIRRAEIERSRRKRPENLDAWELYVQALPMVYSPDVAGYTEAIELLERAIALDPGYTPALALASWAYEKRLSLGGDESARDEQTELSLSLAERALAADPDDPVAIGLMGWLRVLFRRDRDGVEMCERAVALNPNNRLVLNYAAVAHLFAGDLEKLLEYSRRALELSPGAPDNYVSFHDLASGYLASGRFEEAVMWGERSVRSNPGYLFSHVCLAAAYAHVGRLAEAREEISAALALRPNHVFADSDLLEVHQDRHRFWLEGVRLALQTVD